MTEGTHEKNTKHDEKGQTEEEDKHTQHTRSIQRETHVKGKFTERTRNMLRSQFSSKPSQTMHARNATFRFWSAHVCFLRPFAVWSLLYGTNCVRVGNKLNGTI